jgi:hypothetical protein
MFFHFFYVVVFNQKVIEEFIFFIDEKKIFKKYQKYKKIGMAA